MIFDYVNISPEKSEQENIKAIKAFLDDLVDRLNLQSQEIEKIKESEDK